MTMAKYEKVYNKVIITANPVTVTLEGLDIEIQSIFTFEEGSSSIKVERNILNDLHGEEVILKEYFTGGFGTVEYQKDMTNLTLGVDEEEIKFSYLGRKVIKENSKKK